MSTIMDTPSTFLGLDGTAWTAIAAIIALAVSAWSIAGSPFLKWLKRSKITLNFPSAGTRSELSNGSFFVRVPVENLGLNPAFDVEVSLDSVAGIGAGLPIIPNYLPIRIMWCHGGHPLCARLAGRSSRLLDFGAVSFRQNGNIDNFAFNFEVTPATPILLPPGTYELTLILTSSESVFRQRIRMEVINAWMKTGMRLDNLLRFSKV